MGEGVASQVAIHIDGTGTSNGSGRGRRRAADQGLQPDEHREQQCRDSNGPNPPWSRYMSWVRQRA